MTTALWYAGRGTGVVALVLMTVVMVLGIGSRAGRPVFGLPRFAVTMVHRNAALIATVLIVIHVTTLLFDPYAQLKLLDAVVPFNAAYRPVWMGLGTVGLDLTIAILVTTALRNRLGARVWRGVHWFAYAMWPVAWLHGIGTGTDRGAGWYLAVSVVSAIAVAAALGWRLSTGFETLGGRRVRRRLNPTLAPTAPTASIREAR